MKKGAVETSKKLSLKKTFWHLTCIRKEKDESTLEIYKIGNETENSIASDYILIS